MNELYDQGVNAQMLSDPEFAEAEREVRSIEFEINKLRPRVKDSGSYSGRVQMEFDEARARLTELETRHREAMEKRDTLLRK